MLHRDGCRPYVEIYQGEDRIITTQQDPTKVPLHHISRGKVSIQLNVTVIGDITIIIYHARYILGRPTGIKMLQIQFHTGFLPASAASLSFSKGELDDLSEEGYYQAENFSVSMSIVMQTSSSQIWVPWQNHSPKNYDSDILFSSKLEADELRDSFGSQLQKPKRSGVAPSRPIPPRPPPPSQLATSDDEDESNDRNEYEEISDDATPKIGNNLLNLAEPNEKNSTFGVDLLNIENKQRSFEKEDGINLLDISDEEPSNKMESKSNSANVMDLLGDLGSFTSQPIDIKATPTTFTNKTTFDPFDFIPPSNIQERLVSSTTTSNTNLLGSSTPFQNSLASNMASMQRNVSTPNLTGDAFSDLGNIKNGLTKDGSAFSTQNRPGSCGVPYNSSTPISPAGSPIRHTKSPCEPNYSRSHFDNVSKAVDAQGNQTNSKSGEDIFGDLLGSQGYAFSSSKGPHGPRTMNQMRKVELTKEMDTDKLKVMEWTEGKTHNIRALLCSMHTIMWEGSTWNCEMHQLISAADVKKAYRRACLAVHPDKQIGTSNEKLAKLMFMELNNAWSEFEKDASQQNMFH